MKNHYVKLAMLFLFALGTTNAFAQTTVIAKNASWNYLDDGSDQGTTWDDSTFNDGTWSTGTAPLGYGSITGATLGTSTINNNATTYFRDSFTIAHTNYQDIDISVMCDDGLVVYINGNQVYSYEMPGSFNYTTYASSAASGSDEGDYHTVTVSNSYLAAGKNIVAVELHNASSTSSDLAFDLEMVLNPLSSYVVNSGDSWDYWDQGSLPTGNWNSDTNYSVASWGNGSSLLGYGTIDGRTVATTVSYGGNASNVYPTTYFRTTFSIADTNAVSYFDMDYVRDDGIIIYVNGVEVTRDGLASGSIGYSDYANQTIGGSDEGAWNNTVVSPTLLHQGLNVIAAEVHQTNATSSDVSFDLRFETLDAINASVTRGPYIQNTTDSTAIVRWRTNVPTASSVVYGTTHGTYGSSVDSSGSTTEHTIKVSGLTPNTKYYYHLSTNGSDTVGRYDNTYYFRTNPTPGVTTERVGFWILGDQGQPGTGQTGVHTTFLNSGFRDSMDLILMLGDNAYNSGTDSEFQSAVFDTRLDSVMRNTPVYSTVGNHEVRYITAHSISTPETTPYYLIHEFPTQGEGGGLASGTESYYSWDYGNVHFISINAEEEDLDSSTSTMWSWCESDLQQNTMDWIIVIVHQGPYTKGSHNSDTEAEHVDFRENFLPLLERYGVDLTMSGHSHSYERSKLVKGHFGTSGTYSSGSHDIDGGYGRMPQSGSLTNDCAYEKTTTGAGAGEGAIYCTAGSSSKKGSYAINHPVMKVNWNTYGSVYVEVYDNKMSYWYLEDNGDTTDYFQILKDTDYDSVHNLTDSTVTLTASWPEGPYLWSTGATTRSITLTLGDDSLVSVQNISGSTPCMIDTFDVNFPSIVRYPFTEMDTTGLTSKDADGSVVIVGDSRTGADANGWYYYYNSAEPDALLFAARNSTSGGNTLPIDNVIDYIEIRKANLYNRIVSGIDSFRSVMPYDWNVVTLSQPNGDMDIKFYFDPAEMAAFTTVMDSIEATNTDFVAKREWFKANQGSGVSFLNSDIIVDSVLNSTDLTGLLVSAPNYTTGVGSTDGTPWVDQGNGKNYIQLNGLSSFSGGGLTQSLFDPTPVPVTWLAFNCSWVGKNAELIWQTAQESDNDYFVIERSIDNILYEEVDRVMGNGTTTSISTYFYTDTKASGIPSNEIYYRIKQVDYNGKETYSDVVTLVKDAIDAVYVYPNPTADLVTIDLNESFIESAVISIFNLEGKEIHTTEKLNGGAIKIDLTAFEKGPYVVVINTQHTLYTYKLIKE
jgi:hypothetical protein